MSNEQARRQRNKRAAITAGIVVLLAAVIAVAVQFSRGGTTASVTMTPPSARVGQHSLLVGDKSAKLKVVVFEDFLCPRCLQFERATRDFLHQDAAEGKVLVEYRPFRLLQDPYSKRALNAWGAVLQKGTPAQALKFHDLLYDNQPLESANKPDNAKLMALAKQAGVTDQSVLDAFNTEDVTFYTAVQKAAKKANATQTPYVLVNGKPLTGSSTDDEAANLENLIARS